MDILFQFLITLLPLLIFIHFYGFKRPTSYRTGREAPQADGAWPIIGHLHLFGSHQLTHKTLGAMADKYGPLFTIRLGSHRVLVLSSSEMAKECFTVHDKVFSTRPSVAATKLLGYNCAMFGFAPYGSYWREMRKIATIELLSNHKLSLIKHIRASEVENAIKELYKVWTSRGKAESGVVVDMKQWFGDLTHNVALRMVGGKRCFGNNTDIDEGEARKCQKVIREFLGLFGAFVLSDAIPFLGWLDFKGYEKAMKKAAKEMDSIIGGWLEEHKQKRLLCVEEEEEKEKDFMDVLLTILGDAKVSGFDADTINKATCLNLISGGDAIGITLTWALSLLLNSPHELQKVQAELDSQISKDRHVEESDIQSLVYLQAVVKETLRLYPPTPVNAFRAAMEDCTLSGYHIAAGTRLMLNTWKIQHDESMWPNANEFQPERFLSSHKDTDVRGKSFEFIPFGSGRRACPAVSLALQVVHLALASFLHSFEVAKPSNMAVDMTEGTGMNNLKATPLEVILTPRLNSRLYEL